MRRLILAATLLVSVFGTTSPAAAFWHHRWGCWGWRCGWGGCWGPRWGCYRVAYGCYPGCWGIGAPVCYGGVPVCYGPGYGSYTIGATVGWVGPGYGVMTATLPARSPIIVLRPATGVSGACTVPPASAPERASKASPAPSTSPPAAPAPSAPGTMRGTAPRSDLVLRASLEDRLTKARRLIDEGDALFRRQQFHSALQKYKQAVVAAPELAEAHWRQGHALVAVGEYAQASTALKRALALSDEVDRGGFRLATLYGSAVATKELHLERLAEWTLAHQRSPDGYFLIGLTLWYDSQTTRAVKFLRRAGDLSLVMRDLVAALVEDEAALASDASPAIEAEVPVATAVLPVSLVARGVEL